MLEKQTLNLSLVKGLDTKSDPKQEQVGFMLTLQNVLLKTINEFRKRFGYQSVTTSILGGSTISAGVQNASFNNELLTSDGSSLYSYSSTAVKQVNRGTMPVVNYTSAPVVRNGTNLAQPDSAYNSGYQLNAWINTTPAGGSEVHCCVIDTATGSYVLSDTTLATGGAGVIRCVSIGVYMIVFYKDSSANLVYKYISTATPSTVSGPVTVATDCGNFYALDAVYTSVNNRVYITYDNNTGGVSSYYMDTSLALSAKYTVAADAVELTIFTDATPNIWCVYNTGTDLKAFISNAALTTPVLAVTTVEASVVGINITGVVSGTTATIYYEVAGASKRLNFIRKNTLTLTGTVGTAALFLRQVGIVGKAFVYSSVNYLLIGHESTLQSTYFLVNGSGVVVARFAQGLGGGIAQDVGILGTPAAVNNTSTGIYQYVFPKVDLLTTFAGTTSTQTGIETVSVNFLNPTSQAQQLGLNQHFTGGFVWLYDGNNVVEHGFHLYPDNVTVAGAGAGGQFSNGTYGVSATYEWTDAQGQTHYSAPSPAVSVTLSGGGSNQSIDVTVPYLPLTQKTGVIAPYIRVYCTAANGTIYYLANTGTNDLWANVPTTNTFSYSITLASSTLTGNPILYTTGGEVIDTPAYPCTVLSTFKSRMIANVIDSPLAYQYSKQVIPGQPVEFSQYFVGNIDSKIGSFSAGIAMDDKYIFFGPTSIFYMSGDGPTASGTNNDYIYPQIVASDVGCDNPASVVLMPDGVMFQTPSKGIYIIDRSLQVSYIGAPVEEFNSYTVTSAVMVKNQNQIRFTISNGTALIYDYFVKQWFVGLNISAVGACLWKSNYTYLKSNGNGYYEDTTVYTDAGTAIYMTLKTSWVSFAGVQGYQRCKRLLVLGENTHAHALTINIYYDYSTTIGQTVSVTTAAGGTFEFLIHITQQKCSAIQVEIIETSDASAEDLKISNLAVEVGIKKGLNKLPASVNYG